VVWDDLCTGSRYFEGTISVGGDPINALAQRYFERIICPAKHSSITARGENLIRYVHEHDIHGVIFLLLKFCDPHSFDYPYLKEYLDKEGMPNMLLEIESQLPPEGQLLTRFDTFVQML
jgi:benzoyl-CoA reductase/2-hydroxyglutaryl-CoA dehydratase subunit BcrC/BadD/HgdB